MEQYKSITPIQRQCNIISRAVGLGFVPFTEESFHNVYLAAESFLINYAPVNNAECQIKKDSSGQSISWTDGMGFTFEEWGELYDPPSLRDKPEGSKIFYTYVVDSEANVVSLYFRK